MRCFKPVLYASLIFGVLTAPLPAAADDLPFFGIFPRVAERIWYISNGWSNGEHQSCEWRKELIGGHEGALTLTLSDRHKGHVRKIGCAEIQSKARFGYGRYEARMKTVAGSGLNTAFFTYTGPSIGTEHDEIDFEFLGKKNNLLQVGYWRNAKNYDVKVIDLGFDVTADFHSYGFEWYPDKIIWYVDDTEIHRSTAGNPIPVHKSKLFFSLWSGGKGMKDWLGRFKYTGPKTAEVTGVKFTPFPEEKDTPKP